MNKIAGTSFCGARKENFFFCLLEYFPESKRWSLSSLQQVKDEEGADYDQALQLWIKNHALKNLVLDFPIQGTACDSCLITCPGTHLCPEETVVKVREMIREVLESDSREEKENPKKYEQLRVQSEEIDFTKTWQEKKAIESPLSRSFKRRLKRGYVPYWNRPLDFWVWSEYYDQLLYYFKSSYDSFGQVSAMLQARFRYLKRHFSRELVLYESHINICLLELFRSGVIDRKDLFDLKDLETVALARQNVLKKIEMKLNVFIYQHDWDILLRHPKAFDSFLLALAGRQYHLGASQQLPNWTNNKNAHFICPRFPL